MIIKNRIIIFIMLILLTAPVFAQRLEQRLSWSVENAFRYEVILQRMEANRFTPHLVESTTEQFLIVPLFPGFYRFLVIPYDVLDRPSKESEWIYFQVVPLKEDDKVVEEIVEVVEIEKIIEEEIPEEEIAEEVIEVIEEIVDTGMIKAELLEPLITIHRIAKKRAEEEFKEKIMDDSPRTKPEWEVFEEIPPMIIRIGAAWAPFYMIHGTNDDMEELPMSMNFYISFLAKAPGNINIGTEFALLRYSLDPATTPLEDFQYDVDLGINMLALKWLSNEKAAFVMKAGALFPLSSGRDVQFNLGAAIYWRLLDKLLLETGCDYSSSRSEGFFRPYIGLSLFF